jgi:hypothetical protein
LESDVKDVEGQNNKHSGRLAQAVITARIAIAVATPLNGAVAPVQAQGGTPPNRDAPTSQRAVSSNDEQLSKVQEAANRERRRAGVELGYQLKQPDVVLDPTVRARKRRGR